MSHLTKREKEILACLKKNPMISQDELAAKMRISRSAAAVHISNLMRKGYILGRGYIFDERSGVLVIGKSWLEITARVASREIDIDCGGLGYIMAMELVQCHISPTLLTILGQDDTGDQIYNHLLQKGVQVRPVIRSRDYPTAKRLHVLDGETVLYRVEEMGIIQSLDEEKLTTRNDIIKSAKVLLIDATLPPAEIEYLVTLVKCYNLLSSLIGCPLDWYRQKGFFSYPQVFFVCREYELPGFAGGDPEGCFPACREIVSQGLAALIVVFGEQGVVLATPKETVYLPASPLQGPGSTLSITAGIAGGLAAGHSFRLAVRRALGSTASGQHPGVNV